MTLATAGLLHYWRAHLAVALGVAAGASALVGAMLVGDSLRGSLRDQAAARTAGIDFAVVAGAPFADDLPQRLGTRLREIGQAAEVLQALRLPAAVRSADSGERVNGAAVYGIDGSWARSPHSVFSHAPAEDEAILSDALARELHVSAGQDVVLYLPRHTDSSPETLFGRRHDATVPLRLRVGGVLPAVGMGEFSLRPAADRARNVFANRSTVARATRLTGTANLLLVTHSASSDASGVIEKALRESLSLRDVGAHIRVDSERGYLSIESRSLLIAPEIESAAFGAAADAGAAATGIISYLANEIRLTEQPERSIPYSTVAAITPGSTVAAKFEQSAGEPFAEFHSGQILLNEWAAKSLGANVGNALDLTYYVTGKFGAIETRTSTFTLGGIVALRGAAADPGFVPTLAGVTDAPHMGDWDPPFPVDLKKIRPQDEQYWDEHRTTPKAFILFDDGKRRWTEADGRFGVLTSIRVEKPGTEDLAALAKRVESSLLARVRPASLGWSIIALHDMAKAAADGPTDFAQLFLAFSFFLIVSGLILVALLFRLGVERRGVEIGTLLALGFRPRTVLRVLLAEGAVVAGVGSLLGLAGAVGYAALLLAGLRTIWSAAATAPALALHVQPTSLLLGYVINLACAMFAIWASVRRIAELPPRTLLAGNAGAESQRQSTRRDHGRQMLIV
ncbi:MAG: ABC transporter permease, partial [Planctomycetes bacterium]|nr:ABC transporter permease [Planctomycetota bacterium]